MLSESQKQFVFKRTLFHKISNYLTWSIGCSTIITWGLIYWLKPEMVNPQAVLELLQEKKESGVDLSQITDISILAVSGVTAISALFFLLIVLTLIMNSCNKRERQYLEIITSLGGSSYY